MEERNVTKVLPTSFSDILVKNEYHETVKIDSPMFFRNSSIIKRIDNEKKLI